LSMDYLWLQARVMVAPLRRRLQQLAQGDRSPEYGAVSELAR
jgi:hypothetical protein